MKVLVYNFVQPDEPGKQAGGVAVYQRNLTKALLAGGHSVVSMSSGDRYSVLRRKPYLYRQSVEDGDAKFDRLIIYNSPVTAPAHSAFYNLASYNESADLDRIPREIRRLFGIIDVFHFQNIEGLTASFFRELRAVFPHSRLLFSAHNYNIVCPQVNLWFRETSACNDYRAGRACVNCIGGHGAHPQELNVRRLDTIISGLGIRRHGRASKFLEFAIRSPFRLKRLIKRTGALLPKQAVVDPTGRSVPKVVVSPELASPYRTYRETNVALCRDVFDRVLAVSDRSRSVLAKHGLDPKGIAVSYIGTAHYERFLRATKKTTIGSRLHIAYLGYMRRDKGFFFFLECLHLVSERLAQNLDITVAAPYGTDWPLEQLKQVGHRFHSITLHNGYTHASIDKVLKGVDLGIVPVLWEDNLPQVAIEIVSRGLPILTSDKGGVSEIASSPSFTFRAGSKRDFLNKLERIATGQIPLREFWNTEPRIFSMEQHVEDLMGYYRPASAAPLGHVATSSPREPSPSAVDAVIG